jgi:hypothetical protein
MLPGVASATAGLRAGMLAEGTLAGAAPAAGAAKQAWLVRQAAATDPRSSRITLQPFVRMICMALILRELGAAAKAPRRF